MIQAFKANDTAEAQTTAVIMPSLDAIGVQHDMLYDDCFQSYLLGDVLYDLGRDPLSDVITRDVYRSSFPAIHDLFTRPGTFEFYLAVFRKIFSADVVVTFSIPAPGKLNIVINSQALEKFNIMARRIVADVYAYDKLVTSDVQDEIVGQGNKGIKTQAQIDALINEISAYGIYTTVQLVTA